MKFSGSRIVPLTLSLILASASSGGYSRPGLSPKPQTKEAKAAAQRTWPSFWAEVRLAIRRRDRAALRGLMSEPFNGPPLTIADAFRQWDDPKVQGWQKLDAVIRLGTVIEDQSENDDNPERIRPARIGPPAAARRGYKGWLAVFEFQEDGKWRFIQFTK